MDFWVVILVHHYIKFVDYSNRSDVRGLWSVTRHVSGVTRHASLTFLCNDSYLKNCKDDFDGTWAAYQSWHQVQPIYTMLNMDIKWLPGGHFEFSYMCILAQVKKFLQDFDEP